MNEQNPVIEQRNPLSLRRKVMGGLGIVALGISAWLGAGSGSESAPTPAVATEGVPCDPEVFECGDQTETSVTQPPKATSSSTVPESSTTIPESSTTIPGSSTTLTVPGSTTSLPVPTTQLQGVTPTAPVNPGKPAEGTS